MKITKSKYNAKNTKVEIPHVLVFTVANDKVDLMMDYYEIMINQGLSAEKCGEALAVLADLYYEE